MSVTGDCPKAELVGRPCTGETLDKLIQPAVLAVPAEGAMHGCGLAERIGALPSFAGGKRDVSGVYRYLKAMERKGLVLSSWRHSESGPAKKTYQLTAAGQRRLRRWAPTLEKYRKAISALLSTARSPVQKQRR